MPKLTTIKKVGLLTIASLLYFSSYSQENYIAGQIVKTNKDTINGFVDYRNWDKNPDFIKFKTSIDEKPLLYSPTEILEFRVNDEIYVSAIISIEVSPLDAADLEFDNRPNTKLDTTFLQTLFKGKKELYFYRNQERRDNFYIKQNGNFELLLYKKYLKIQNGKNVVIENNRFIGQLMLYLNDCADIEGKLKNVSYDLGSLYKLFKFYNECSESKITFQKEEIKLSTEFGVLAGATLSTLNFESINFPYLVNVDYGQSVNPTVGVFLDLIFPRNHGKWSINNELMFTSYNFEGIYDEYENENVYSSTATQIANSYLKLNSLIRFKYPIGSTFMFINGGMSNGITLRSTNYKKVESTFYFDDKVEEGQMLDRVAKYENGLILGTGLKYNNYSLELRAESGSGMSVYSSLSSKVMRYFFLFGYTF